MNERVLLADTDSAVRSSLRKVLPECDVYEADNPAAALSHCSSVLFELLVIDVEFLAGMEWQAFEELLTNIRPAALIVLAGPLCRSDLRLGSESGVVLPKPVEVERFLQTVKSLLAAAARRPQYRISGCELAWLRQCIGQARRPVLVQSTAARWIEANSAEVLMSENGKGEAL